MTENMDILTWLQDWYLKQCDGDWEHGYTIHIGGLDNPGWMVDIHLEGTSLEDKTMPPVEIDRSDSDWIFCKIEGNVFKGRSGPKQLGDILEVFRSWVENRA